MSKRLLFLIAGAQLRLPLLESLSMPVFETGRHRSGRPLGFFNKTSLLRHLHLDNVAGERGKMSAPIMRAMPWAQLRSRHECFHILSHSPELLSFASTSPGNGFSDPDDRQIISLPDLVSLKFQVLWIPTSTPVKYSSGSNYPRSEISTTKIHAYIHGGQK